MESMPDSESIFSNFYCKILDGTGSQSRNLPIPVDIYYWSTEWTLWVQLDLIGVLMNCKWVPLTLSITISILARKCHSLRAVFQWISYYQRFKWEKKSQNVDEILLRQGLAM